MPTTTFWLMHAGSGLCFVLFKFVVGHHLDAGGVDWNVKIYTIKESRGPISPHMVVRADLRELLI